MKENEIDWICKDDKIDGNNNCIKKTATTTTKTYHINWMYQPFFHIHIYCHAIWRVKRRDYELELNLFGWTWVSQYLQFQYIFWHPPIFECIISIWYRTSHRVKHHTYTQRYKKNTDIFFSLFCDQKQKERRKKNRRKIVERFSFFFFWIDIWAINVFMILFILRM